MTSPGTKPSGTNFGHLDSWIPVIDFFFFVMIFTFLDVSRCKLREFVQDFGEGKKEFFIRLKVPANIGNFSHNGMFLLYIVKSWANIDQGRIDFIGFQRKRISRQADITH
jgi:hypothetical protein